MLTGRDVRVSGGGQAATPGGSRTGHRFPPAESLTFAVDDARRVSGLLQLPAGPRACLLQDAKVPMLFLQGTRDALADLELLAPLIAKLGERATLKVFHGSLGMNVKRQ